MSDFFFQVMRDPMPTVPPEAWFTLIAVVVGALISIIVVTLTNRSNLRQLKLQLDTKAKNDEAVLVRERMEELYVLLSNWINVFFGDYLNLTLVIKGELSYDEYLDITIKDGKSRKFDFNRIEMLFDIYAPTLKADFDNMLSIRSKVNEIRRLHKRAYQEGGDGERYLNDFTKQQMELEKACEQLELKVAEHVRVV